MRDIAEFPQAVRRRIRYVLTDIDDTLTTDGRLTAAAYQAIEALAAAGLKIVAVTGRPAGWCDMIARLWPVDAVIGENGAFYFRYDHMARAMRRRFWLDAAVRAEHRVRLDRLAGVILAAVPGAAVAADQPYRVADLAIDFCEDVAPLPDAAVAQIVALFEQAGAQAKISSIHVNGWFGDYDKLAMAQLLFAELYDAGAEAMREHAVYIGDSPNDAPMFGFFPHAIGVANVARFAGKIAALPAYVTTAAAGAGFAEFAAILLA